MIELMAAIEDFIKHHKNLNPDCALMIQLRQALETAQAYLKADIR